MNRLNAVRKSFRGLTQKEKLKIIEAIRKNRTGPFLTYVGYYDPLK